MKILFPKSDHFSCNTVKNRKKNLFDLRIEYFPSTRIIFITFSRRIFLARINYIFQRNYSSRRSHCFNRYKRWYNVSNTAIFNQNTDWIILGITDKWMGWSYLVFFLQKFQNTKIKKYRNTRYSRRKGNFVFVTNIQIENLDHTIIFIGCIFLVLHDANTIPFIIWSHLYAHCTCKIWKITVDEKRIDKGILIHTWNNELVPLGISLSTGIGQLGASLNSSANNLKYPFTQLSWT